MSVGRSIYTHRCMLGSSACRPHGHRISGRENHPANAAPAKDGCRHPRPETMPGTQEGTIVSPYARKLTQCRNRIKRYLPHRDKPSALGAMPPGTVVWCFPIRHQSASGRSISRLKGFRVPGEGCGTYLRIQAALTGSHGHLKVRPRIERAEESPLRPCPVSRPPEGPAEPAAFAPSSSSRP